MGGSQCLKKAGHRSEVGTVDKCAAHFPSIVEIHVSQQMLLSTSPAEKNAMVVAECFDLSLSTISLHGSIWQLLLSLYLLGK